MATFNLSKFKAYLKKGNIHYFFKKHSHVVLIQLFSESGSIVHLKKIKTDWTIQFEFHLEAVEMNGVALSEKLLDAFVENQSIPGPVLVILPGYQSVSTLRNIRQKQSVRQIVEQERRQFKESVIHHQELSYTHEKHIVISKTSKAFLTQFDMMCQKYNILISEFITYLDFWTQCIELDLFDFNVSAYTLVSDIQSQKHHLFMIRNHKLCFYRSVSHIDWKTASNSDKFLMIQQDIEDSFQLIQKIVPNCKTLSWYCQSGGLPFEPSTKDFITSSHPLHFLGEDESSTSLQIHSIDQESISKWINSAFLKSQAFVNQRARLLLGFWFLLMIITFGFIISLTMSSVALYDYRINELNKQYKVLVQSESTVMKEKKSLEDDLSKYNSQNKLYDRLMKQLDNSVSLGYLLEKMSQFYSPSIKLSTVNISTKKISIKGEVIFKDSQHVMPRYIESLNQLPFVLNSNLVISQNNNDLTLLGFRISAEFKSYDRKKLNE